MAHLVLDGVEKSFDGVPACAGVDLSVEKGEFFTFLGPSGCGKTTTLRLIAGFIPPEKGSILLDGKDITHLAPEKRQVGMVFQNYSLFPYLTVSQNIEYGLKIRKKTASEVRECVDRHMDMVGLSGYGSRRIDELSGGEQQRVALARSLAVEPGLLLLDEPLSNLDARLRDKMREELKDLQKRLGITTVFVTHDQTEALTLSDRIAVFHQGRLVQTGTPAQIYSEPRDSFVAGFVGDTNLIQAECKNGRAILPGSLELRTRGTGGAGSFVSIRPQDITLSTDRTRADNCLEGRVQDVQLNGACLEITLSTAGPTLRATALNTVCGPGIEPGARVYASFSGQAVAVLEK